MVFSKPWFTPTAYIKTLAIDATKPWTSDTFTIAAADATIMERMKRVVTTAARLLVYMWGGAFLHALSPGPLPLPCRMRRRPISQKAMVRLDL